jgi:hypothetical protein
MAISSSSSLEVPLEGSPNRPIVWWASIGAVFFALQVKLD